MIYDKYIKNMFQSIIDKFGLEQTIINFVIILGIILIYTYVFYNFYHAKKRIGKKKKEVKSVVETASMSFFFLIIACVINLVRCRIYFGSFRNIRLVRQLFF